MEALQATNVCRAYGKRKVLDGLSLMLKEGEFAALMGPSGSGKSTFLHVAAGLLSADDGAVVIGGTDIVPLGDAAATRFRRRRIGVVFQSFHLLETLSIYENIVLPLKLDRRRVDRSRVEALISRLGLKGLESKYPCELSGGECQRVAVARALVTEPAVVLADEPTGNLDNNNAWEIMKLLEEINERGTTVIVVTHNMEIVKVMKKRVITVQKGVIVSDNKKDDYSYEY